MTFNSLRLCNFGPFPNVYEIDLSLTDQGNVILFGGMNGAGKTSILTALRLVLLGKIGAKQTTGGQAYQKVLESYIHRSNPNDETWIELDYRLYDTKDYFYRIRRSWNNINNSIQENFYYHKIRYENGQEIINNLLLDGMNWYGNLETFFPPQISELFLFDGERIEEMADPKKTSQILSSSIDALFGGGTITQLEKDLKILEKDLLQEQAEITGDSELKDMIDTYKEIDRELQQKQNIIELKKEQIQDIKNTNQNIRKSLREIGGEYFHKREEFEEKLQEALHQINNLNEDIIQLMNQELPYHLLLDWLPDIVTDAEGTLSSGDLSIVEEIMQKRDSIIINSAQNLDISTEALSNLEKMMNSTPIPSGRSSLGCFYHAESLEGKRILNQKKETLNSYRILHDEYNETKQKIQYYRDALAQLPSVEKAQPLIDKLNLTEDQLIIENKALTILEDESHDIEISLDENRRLLLKYAIEHSHKLERSEEIQRTRTRIEDVQKILTQFRNKILRKRLDLIRSTALSLFNQLHRKKNMVRELLIDSISLEITLVDHNNRLLDLTRLSAGERQMLATSLLWAIAKCSGKTLPFVIDTPLGRLDSVHRENLVTQFFPFASHQVILLSTDEEIKNKEYQALSPYIVKEYGIHYDSEHHSSYIKEEYPFKEIIEEKSYA